MSGFDLHIWKHLPCTAQSPSYALVLRNALENDDDKLVICHGVWMTAGQAQVLKRLNKDSSSVNTTPQIPNRSPSPLDKSSFRIMDLPFDLRQKVLQFDALDYVSQVLPPLHIPVYPRDNNCMMPTAIRLPPITQAADRTLRLQSILVTIKLMTLESHSGPGNAMLQEWLSSLNLEASGETTLRNGFEAVHSLDFPYFSRFPYYILPADAPNNDIELMHRCENLRDMTINFAHQTLRQQGRG